jgi:hypothetical protein
MLYQEKSGNPDCYVPQWWPRTIRFHLFFVFQERCGCDSLLKLLAKVAKNLKILQVIEHTLSFYQGDQTGRIFGHWAIVYLRQFLEN